MSISEGVQGGVSPSVLCAARVYAAACLSVIPIQANGSKTPAWDQLPRGPDGKATWKPYQAEPPSADELDVWFENHLHGIAIIAGQVSGGLEIIDFEDAALFEQWRERVEAEAPGLVQRLPVIQTPRPGRHVYYRCAQAEGSQKLARTADGHTLIERKGEGGYVLAPGSPAACHPSGRPYEHLSGPPLTIIPLITPDERALLLAAARSFDAAAPDPVGDDQGGRVAAAMSPGPESQAAPIRTDSKNSRERARLYLHKCDPAISGQGGHAQTFKVACALLHGFHLDDGTAYSLLLNDYNPRCVPPWSEKELRHKVESARIHGSYHDMLNQAHHPAGPSANGQAARGPNDSGSQAPQGGGTIWKPVPISQLTRVAPPDSWVWQGILAPGKITLLSAEAKAGKTTLLSLLYQRMASGGSLCGTNVWPGRVIVVSEEPADLWLDRRERLGLGDHLEILPMPFVTKPTQRDWERMIWEALQALKQNPAALVVWDTLSHLWWVADENDNAKEATALMPLRRLCDTGAALALVHHFGAEKNGPRGGTELRGFPDVLAELHLHKAGDFANRRRILKVRGRLAVAPCQLVIDLNETADDYLVVEGVLSAGQPGLWAVLTALVPGHPPGLSGEEFRKQWPTQPPPDYKRIAEALKGKWEAAGWQRTGNGGRGKPFRYWRPQSGTDHSSA